VVVEKKISHPPKRTRLLTSDYHHVCAAVRGGRKKKIPSPKEDSVTDLGQRDITTTTYAPPYVVVEKKIPSPKEDSVTDLGQTFFAAPPDLPIQNSGLQPSDIRKKK
jgi:hypothetical protein